MATANIATRAEIETQTLEQPVTPYHFGAQNILWDELADEARHYLELIAALKQLPSQHVDRDIFEIALYGSVAHLELHARGMGETMDAELEQV